MTLCLLMADWKRLLLADGPRQSINALTLYSFAYANGFNWNNLPEWWDNSTVTAMLLFSICFTVLIFAGSLILLIAASILYVPFLCYIQGNLKVSHSRRSFGTHSLMIGIRLSQSRQTNCRVDPKEQERSDTKSRRFGEETGEWEYQRCSRYNPAAYSTQRLAGRRRCGKKEA